MINKRNKIMKEYNSVVIRIIEDCYTASNPVTEKIAIGNLFRLQRNILNSSLRRRDKDILTATITDAMIKMCNRANYRSESDRLTDSITVPVFNNN